MRTKMEVRNYQVIWSCFTIFNILHSSFTTQDEIIWGKSPFFGTTMEVMFGNVGYVYIICCPFDSSVSSVNAALSRLSHPNTNAHTHTSSGPFIRLDSERGPEPWGLTLNLTVTLQILSWRRRVLHLLLSFKTLNSLSPWNVRPIKKSQGFEFFFLLR